MRLRIYNLFVNKQPGISERYHRLHDGTNGVMRLISWLYLLWLNFAFYFLFCRWLGKKRDIQVYEQKKLNLSTPESQLDCKAAPEDFAAKLMDYDVISFDMFDTLVFRPFSEPTDLFYFMGQQLNYMDFKRIRMEAEAKARWTKFKAEESFEVTLDEIWQQLSEGTGIPKDEGLATEINIELAFCYGNSYIRSVFEILKNAGKHMVVTSDMYLPSEVLRQILDSCGFTGFDKVYVSNECGKSKGKGDLFQLVAADMKGLYGESVRLAHVGDNPISDVKKARRNGFHAFHYQNVNKNALLYRTYDLSPIIGGAYRGIVNNRLYSGEIQYNFNQEFGFIYGGLFILGYCHFIHDYALNNGIDKVLFLSRDGEIIKRAYNLLYPDDPTEYVYISRLASAKWSAKYMKYDFLRKLVYHKVGLEKTMSTVLSEMELSELEDAIDAFKSKKPLGKDRVLTPENVESFVEFINANWDRILDIYEPQVQAAGSWYRNIIGTAKNVLAVDIGWAGTGAIALKILFEKEWNIDCRITGMVAGTNTAHNAEPDMSETMLLDGTLVSYLYSSRFNRDIWKKHNPALDYNLYFELITSSALPSFKGFYFDESGNVESRFSEPEPNPQGISDIGNGIMDFVEEYNKHFKNYDFMFNISGRDAYAPMLLAASNNQAYLKKIYKDFDLKVPV